MSYPMSPLTALTLRNSGFCEGKRGVKYRSESFHDSAGQATGRATTSACIKSSALVLERAIQDSWWWLVRNVISAPSLKPRTLSLACLLLRHNSIEFIETQEGGPTISYTWNLDQFEHLASIPILSRFQIACHCHDDCGRIHER